MQHFWLTLGWIFGVASALLGLLALTQSLLAGICLIFISALLLPPSRQYIFNKLGKDFSLPQRSGAIIVLVFASSYFMSESGKRDAEKLIQQEAQETADKEERLTQDRIEYFNMNRKIILASLNNEMESENYREVISQAKEYLPSRDSELSEITKQAQLALVEAQREKREAAEKARSEKRTEDILSQLKNISVSSYKANNSLYKELADMHPDESLYQEKMAFYSSKLEAKNAKEQAENDQKAAERKARIARFGTPPVQSAWDGSYLAVERYLSRMANDPDSINISGCTKVYHADDGWLVGCDYRGRNGFGGMIRQSNWFSIVHGSVTGMHESSAYNL
jgi:hypothetical protein